MRLLITGERGPGGFPPPVTDPRSRYRLCRTNEVDHWFRSDLGHESGDTHTDRLGAAINAGLELRRHRTHLTDAAIVDLRTLVGL